MARTFSNFFAQWPDNLPVLIANGAPNMISLGMITPPSNASQLSIMGVMLYIRGMAAQSSVTMQVKIFRNSTLIATSELWTVSEILTPYGSTDNYLGWVRFQFTPRFNMAANTYAELHLGNYSYDESTKWVGAVLDWPTTMGYNTVPASITAAPVAMELYGYEAIR